jgi:hypothetical protein
VQCFYLLSVAPTCFGLSYWLSSETSLALTCVAYAETCRSIVRQLCFISYVYNIVARRVYTFQKGTLSTYYSLSSPPSSSVAHTVSRRHRCVPGSVSGQSMSDLWWTTGASSPGLLVVRCTSSVNSPEICVYKSLM